MHHFVLTKLATRSIRVKKKTVLNIRASCGVTCKGWGYSPGTVSCKHTCEIGRIAFGV